MKTFMVAAAVAAAVAVAVPAAVAVAEPVPVAVKVEHARVITEPGKVLEDADVLMKDGVIVAVGKNVPTPTGTRVWDGTGKTITAGFIDVFTTLGLNEVDLEPASNDGYFEGEGGVHAAFRVTDGYNTDSIAIPVTRTGGVTSVIAVPRGGVVSGVSAWVSTADAASVPGVPSVMVREGAAMHVWLGEASMGVAGGSRGKVIEKLRELFDDAKSYAARKGAFEKNQTRRFAASRLDLEALALVIQKKLPLVVWAQRTSDILAALRLARELAIRIVIAGGTEAWRVAPALAQANVPVVLDPMDNLPGSFETLHVRDDAAKLLTAAGVRVALSGLGEASNVRNLRQRAGVAVASGLTLEQALAAVTTIPASLLGVVKGEARRGVLAKGAAADVVVWSGDPFQPGTRVEHMFIAGVAQSLRTRQTLLLERYRKLK